MVTQAFSIYDRDTGVFHTPFFAPHVAIALRSFKALANDPTTTISRNPESFDLRLIGTFDDVRGELHKNDAPELITLASALVEPTHQLQLIPKETA